MNIFIPFILEALEVRVGIGSDINIHQDIVPADRTVLVYDIVSTLDIVAEEDLLETRIVFLIAEVENRITKKIDLRGVMVNDIHPFPALEVNRGSTKTVVVVDCTFYGVYYMVDRVLVFWIYGIDRILGVAMILNIDIFIYEKEKGMME